MRVPTTMTFSRETGAVIDCEYAEIPDEAFEKFLVPLVEKIDAVLQKKQARGAAKAAGKERPNEA